MMHSTLVMSSCICPVWKKGEEVGQIESLINKTSRNILSLYLFISKHIFHFKYALCRFLEKRLNIHTHMKDVYKKNVYEENILKNVSFKACIILKFKFWEIVKNLQLNPLISLLTEILQCQKYLLKLFLSYCRLCLFFLFLIQVHK